MPTYLTKRVYDDASPDDGFRVLVDRLWPRGVSKERAKLDDWDRDVAPSTQLRQWFHHDATRFEQFSTRYRAELAASGAASALAARVAGQQVVTLLFGAKDTEHNEAVVLRDVLTA